MIVQTKIGPFHESNEVLITWPAGQFDRFAYCFTEIIQHEEDIENVHIKYLNIFSKYTVS